MRDWTARTERVVPRAAPLPLGIAGFGSQVDGAMLGGVSARDPEREVRKPLPCLPFFLPDHPGRTVVRQRTPAGKGRGFRLFRPGFAEGCALRPVVRCSPRARMENTSGAFLGLLAPEPLSGPEIGERTVAWFPTAGGQLRLICSQAVSLNGYATRGAAPSAVARSRRADTGLFTRPVLPSSV